MTTRGDFETRSDVDIGKGLYHYTHGKDADVLCFAYRIGKQEIKLWVPGDPNPQDLFDAIAGGDTFAAWNAIFEWHVWNYVCVPRYGWPELKLESCVDSMAWAAAMNLPQALGNCAEALGLPSDQLKNKRGKELIRKLCIPQKLTKSRSDMWNNDPELLQELYDYCVQDVVAEEAVVKKLQPLSEFEQAVWVATQRINLRGLPVAVDEIRATVEVVEKEKDRLNHELEVLTEYKVYSATQRSQLETWLNERLAEPLPDLTGDTVEAALKTDLPPKLRRALEIRSHAAQTSTAKHEVLIENVCPDSTVKGLLTYHGASTGRWASRGGLNAQNLPRPSLPDDDLETAHQVLATGDHEAALMVFGDRVMDAAVSTVRGVIKAPAGQEFICVDWSSVENRVGSWVAGQHDKIEMFAAGLDEYKVFAANSLYHVGYDEVTKAQRQVSKSAVLGSLFGQGPKGLVEYAKGYGVTLTEERSKEIVKTYRTEYDCIAAMWEKCNSTVIQAIQKPDLQFEISDKTHVCFTRGALWLLLPSGRKLSWHDPMVELLTTPWGAERLTATVMGVDRFTRKWSRQKLIGSSVYQSIVQATARDLMADALLRLEAAGYPIVLLVHDEFLSLVPEGHGSEDEFIEIMCQAPAWAAGLPLAAESWRGNRYRK